MIAHRIVCRHRVEVEVAPARATLYFGDERWIDPVNTQARFEAIVFNADSGVNWSVLAPGGGPGAGAIDATGLYRAPAKGGLASGATDVVVATARADPLRKAFAWVTLVGEGPLAAPEPRVEIWPKRGAIYYRTGQDNSYIDPSNMKLLFRAILFDAPGAPVQWRVNGGVQGGADPWFLYEAPAFGGESTTTVSVEVAGAPATRDDAKVLLLNYSWPGLI
jgi:hypothetical protein